MNELKPCPFCGGKAIICAPLEGIGSYVIRCENAGCCEKSYQELDSPRKEDLDELIVEWNSRDTDENQQLIECLRSISGTPRTFPEMCCAMNRARIVLEKYQKGGG